MQSCRWIHKNSWSSPQRWNLQMVLQHSQTIQPAMIVAQDVANPPGDANPFLVLGQSAKVTYSFVDADTGRQKEESKSFIVTGIMKETGNPTIDNGIVVNLQAENPLFKKSGKFDSLFVIAQSTDMWIPWRRR